MGIKTITASGYVYDKRIFWSIIAILLMGMGIIFQELGGDFEYKFYYECKLDYCENPLLDGRIDTAWQDYDYTEICRESWCTLPVLPRGEYGSRPPTALKYFPAYVFILVGLGLILNHFIHNKGKRPDLTINVPDKWKKKFSVVWEEDPDNDNKP